MVKNSLINISHSLLCFSLKPLALVSTECGILTKDNIISTKVESEECCCSFNFLHALRAYKFQQ